MIVLNSTLRRTQVGIYNLVSVRLFTRCILCTLVSLIVEEKANKQTNQKQGTPNKEEGVIDEFCVEDETTYQLLPALGLI